MRTDPASRRSGTILVIDDEEFIRIISEAMLLKAGFAVLTASNGAEGVQAFRDHADEILAVLLDATMPHMDGHVVFREIQAVRNDVKVTLTSGFNKQHATKGFTGARLAGFIQKPYSMDQLISKLDQVLKS